MKKELEVRLRVIYGDKMLYAVNDELGIFSQGESLEALMEDICEAIGRNPDIPSSEIKITLDIDPAAVGNVQIARC